MVFAPGPTSSLPMSTARERSGRAPAVTGGDSRKAVWTVRRVVGAANLQRDAAPGSASSDPAGEVRPLSRLCHRARPPAPAGRRDPPPTRDRAREFLALLRRHGPRHVCEEHGRRRLSPLRRSAAHGLTAARPVPVAILNAQAVVSIVAVPIASRARTCTVRAPERRAMILSGAPEDGDQVL